MVEEAATKSTDSSVQTEESVHQTPRRFSDQIDDLLLRVEGLQQRPVLVLGLFLLSGVIIGGSWWLGRSPQVAVDEGKIPTASLTQASTLSQTSTTGQPTEIVVHVAGAVLNPGIVEVPSSSRVVDAVEAAGGPSPSADMHQLNLAQTLQDGTSIIVPEAGEQVQQPLVRGEVAGSSETGADPTSGPINVNTAREAELETLTGVGPATATAIVAWRVEHGPFNSVDGLLDVPGIGPLKLEKMRDRLVIG